MQTVVAAQSSIPDAGVGDSARAMAAAPILLQYWHIALRWKWIILGITAATLFAGVLITLMMPSQYSAETRIEISRQQKNITKVDGVEAERSSQDLEFYQTQYSLLAARSLAERVARQLRLGSSEPFFAAHGTQAPEASASGELGSEVKAREDAAVALLLENLDVSPIRSSALLDLRYTSQSPELSAKIANAWAQQFIAATRDRRLESTADARRYLEQQLEELRQKLEQSERAAVNYASDKGIVTLEQTRDQDGRTQTVRTLVGTDLEALNAALLQATADRVAAQSRAGTNASLLPGLNSSIPALRQRRAELQADYSRLMVQFEPGYPAALAVREQIRALDSSIATEESRLSGGRSSEYAEARKREQMLRDQVSRVTAELDRQQRDTIQFNIYQREADTNRQIYDALLQRYKEIGVAGVEVNNVLIVDPAEVPTTPSSPKLLPNMLVALLAGLGLSVAATLALNQIDEGVRDPARVSRELHVPLLGVVPDSETDDVLELVGDNKSEVSEAYFSIQSSLGFSTDHGVPRVFMVTSTRPAEGKSTTCLALASALGRTGKNVLLLDADMRSPSVHSFFSLPNAEGLSNLLAGSTNAQSMIQPTKLKGVSILSAGPTPPSAAELVSSNRLKVLLEDLLNTFDHVLVDSPPVLGLADAPLISRSVEAVVYVVESGGPAVRTIRNSIERLAAAQANILGVVLTKVSSNSSVYGDGYGYSYSYGDRASDGG